MKLEDKAIDKIVAMFDAEIEEIAKTVEHTAETPADDEVRNETAPESEDVIEETAPEPEDVIEEAAPENADMQPASAEESVTEEEAESETPAADEDAEAEESAAEIKEEPLEESDEADPDIEQAVELPDDAEYPASETAAPAPAVSYSTARNILSAAGYIVAVIAICVLSALCVTLLDNSVQRMKPAAPPDVPQADLATSLQAYTTNEVFAQKAVPQLSLEEIYALDLRKPSGATEDDLKRVSKAGLVGLEDTFLEAEEKYGVNAIFLMSIASLESAHGTQMYRPNNMFGYGGKSYPSKEACIMDVAQGLSSRYLTPGASLYGGSPTLSGVNKRYAANPQWDTKVGKYMKSYYDVIAPYHNQTLDKLK